MPILYEVPPEFWINRLALKAVQGGWSFPPESRRPGRRRGREGGSGAPPPARGGRRGAPRHVLREPGRSVWPHSGKRQSWRKRSTVFAQGLKEAGLVDGRDFTTTYRNAQGDIATLNSLFDELTGNDTDLVVTHLNAGAAGRTSKDGPEAAHLRGGARSDRGRGGQVGLGPPAEVTGVYLAFPYAAMARTVREVLPGARRVGTLFTPGEINSVLARQRFEGPLKAEGLKLVERAGQRPDRGERCGARISASRGSTSFASSRTT